MAAVGLGADPGGAGVTLESIEPLRTWCEGLMHPPVVLIDRGEDEVLSINTNEPLPCIVVNGAALCMVCWTLYGQALTAMAAHEFADRWQKHDAHQAVEEAQSLMEKSA